MAEKDTDFCIEHGINRCSACGEYPATKDNRVKGYIKDKREGWIHIVCDCDDNMDRWTGIEDGLNSVNVWNVSYGEKNPFDRHLKAIEKILEKKDG